MNWSQHTRAALALTLLALVVIAVACSVAPPNTQFDRLYLRADESGRAQLFRQGSGVERGRQLTQQTAGDIIDYAPSPDGYRIVYAVATAEDSAIRIVSSDGRGDQQVLACPAAECSGLVWSPDGRRIVYERRTIDAGSPGAPHLQWLDPGTGATLPLIVGEETPSYGARFSPDGRWLSYVSPADEGVVLYPLTGGEQRLLSSRIGRPAAFGPDNVAVVIGDLVPESYDTAPATDAGAGPPQETTSVYLYLVRLEQEGRERLSPELSVDDSVPAWSPDGQWIAFGRAPADAAAGRQLWLMRADGRDARALTHEPAIFHGPPAWSPDGASLLYQRYDLNDPAAAPQVWLLRLSDGQQILVAEDSYLPAWLPQAPG